MDIDYQKEVRERWERLKECRAQQVKAMGGYVNTAAPMPHYWADLALYAERGDYPVSPVDVVMAISQYAYDVYGNEGSLTIYEALERGKYDRTLQTAAYHYFSQLGEVITPGEAAELLGVASPRVSVLLSTGQLPVLQNLAEPNPTLQRMTIRADVLELKRALDKQRAKAARRRAQRGMA